MSNIEDLQVNYRLCPLGYTSEVYMSGKRDLNSFIGVAHHDKTDGVRKDVSKALGILEKSKKANDIQKIMYKNMLENTERVLKHDIRRALYDIGLHEHHIIGPLPETPKRFANMFEKDLVLEKEFIQTHLPKVKQEISAFADERAILRHGRIPESRKHYVLDGQSRDWKALSYEAPQTNIDVPLLRLRIKAENREQSIKRKAILKDIDLELAQLRQKGLNICALLHILDREIANQEIL